MSIFGHFERTFAVLTATIQRSVPTPPLNNATLGLFWKANRAIEGAFRAIEVDLEGFGGRGEVYQMQVFRRPCFAENTVHWLLTEHRALKSEEKREGPKRGAKRNLKKKGSSR